MEISAQQLEAAAQSMYHGNVAQQQEAVNFFSNWQNSSNALISSVKFLSLTDSSDTLQFVTCCVILYASDQWYNYDREMLNEIRQLMIQYTFAKEHQPMINSKLDEIIAKMAFNDWPEEWENFIPQMQLFLNSESPNQLYTSQAHVFNILTNFLYMINNSPKISLKIKSIML